MLRQRIEEASLNAWPALQLKLYDGWVLKYAEGYTKRANSVNVLFNSNIDLHEKVAVCERFYTGKGLPPVFRLTSFNAPSGLDQLLEQRGYRQVDQSHVLCMDLVGRYFLQETGAVMRDEELPEWLHIYARLSGSTVERQQTHGKILEAIPTRRYPVTVTVEGRAVACGLGVLEDEFLGLFDLVTAIGERGKGYGARLITGLLNRAIAEGARYAYLQVMGRNTSARRLYERLGFRELYHYWYRTG